MTIYRNKGAKVVFVLGVLLLGAFLVRTFWYVPHVERLKIEAEKRAVDLVQDKLIVDSVHNEDVEPLREAFLQSVKTGESNAQAQTYAYFIVLRYLDNNGDIYELYDYFASHKELNFINEEAAKIYPGYFARIESRKYPVSRRVLKYVEASNHLFLAYLQVLAEKGKIDSAELATGAYKAAVFSQERLNRNYYKTASAVDKEIAIRLSKGDLAKSVFFATKAAPDIKRIIEGTMPESEMIPRTKIIAIAHYAFAVRMYELLGVPFESPYVAEQLFGYAVQTSYKDERDLYTYVAYLNALSLALVHSSNTTQIDDALAPIYSLNTTKYPLEKGSYLTRIIDAKKGGSLFMYRKAFIQKLADISPKFKVWLIANGWTEEDFKVKK